MGTTDLLHCTQLKVYISLSNKLKFVIMKRPTTLVPKAFSSAKELEEAFQCHSFLHMSKCLLQTPFPSISLKRIHHLKKLLYTITHLPSIISYNFLSRIVICFFPAIFIKPIVQSLHDISFKKVK